MLSSYCMSLLKSLSSIKRIFSSDPYWDSSHTDMYRFERTFDPHMPKLHSGKLILDWGCASGLSTVGFSERYPDCSVIGLERSYYAHEYAKRHFERSSGVSFVRGNGYNMDRLFKNKKFELIAMMNNMWFVANRFTDSRLQEIMNDVVNHIDDDGYLFLTYNYEIVLFQKEGNSLHMKNTNVDKDSDYVKKSSLLKIARASNLDGVDLEKLVDRLYS